MGSLPTGWSKVGKVHWPRYTPFDRGI